MAQLNKKSERNEATPLLPTSHSGIASVTSSVINLFDEFVGLAILSLPWCLAQGGLKLGLASLGLSAVANVLTFDVLVAACEVAGDRSYFGIAKASLLSGSELCVEMCRGLYLMGISMSATVLVVDCLLGNGTGLLPGLFGIGTHETVATQITASCAFHGLTTLPLSLSPTLEGFKHAASFALAAVMYACAIVIAKAAFEDAPDLHHIDVSGVFRILPVLNYTFLSHYNLPRYYDELKDRTPRRMRRVSYWATFAATILSAALGISGVVAFGNKVKSNVLLEFPAGNVLAMTARAAVLACAVTTLSKIIHPLREIAAHAVFGPMTGGADALLVSSLGTYIGLTTFVVSTVAVAGGFAATYGFSTVIAINSSIFGLAIAYLIPPLILTVLRRRSQLRGDHSEWSLISSINASMTLTVVWGLTTTTLYFVGTLIPA